MADQVVRDSQKVFYPGLIFICGVRETKINDQPVFVVYKVSDWRKYWFDDPDAVLVRTGLYAWKARKISDEMSRNDFDGPLHPDGHPIGLHKYCSQEDWDKDREKFRQQDLFNNAG